MMVMFTKTECRAVDEEGKMVLSEIRTGSNCYMWKTSGIVETVVYQTINHDSSQWQAAMENEVTELSQSKVWKPQSYLRCLQCCDDSLDRDNRSKVTHQLITLRSTDGLPYFLGSQQKDLNHELKARSLTKRFDNESSKLIRLRKSINVVVQCIKSLMISLVYTTESQPELCVDLILCEDTQVVSNPHYLHGVKRVIE